MLSVFNGSISYAERKHTGLCEIYTFSIQIILSKTTNCTLYMIGVPTISLENYYSVSILQLAFWLYIVHYLIFMSNTTMSVLDTRMEASHSVLIQIFTLNWTSGPESCALKLLDFCPSQDHQQCYSENIGYNSKQLRQKVESLLLPVDQYY